MITRRIGALGLAMVCMIACGESPQQPTTEAAEENGIPESVWSEKSHEGALAVAAVREKAEDGGEVVVEGQVKDFVDGRAVFTLTDLALPSCKEREDDDCPTPWDFCCEEPSTIASHTVTVEFHGDDGRPLKGEARGFHGLDHLTKVTVAGTAKRDSSGNVLVIAQSLHASQ